MKKKNCFQIVTPERIYHVRCDTEQDLVDWVNAIRKQQSELLYPSQRSSQQMASSTSAPSVAATSASSPNAAAPVAQAAVGAGQPSAPAVPPANNHDVRVCLCVSQPKRSLSSKGLRFSLQREGNPFRTFRTVFLDFNDVTRLEY